MLDSLKTRFFKNHLQKLKVPKTENSSSNILSNYNSVGLFCNYTDSNNKAILSLEKRIAKNAQRLSTFYFVNKDDSIPSTDDFYQAKDLDWKGVPKSPRLEEFIKKDFDLVIFCINKPLDHFEYTAAQSAAKFKIGPNFLCFTNYCDLLVDMDEGFSFDSYLKQIELFVSL